jgi:hypothetical protein
MKQHRKNCIRMLIIYIQIFIAFCVIMITKFLAAE